MNEMNEMKSKEVPLQHVRIKGIVTKVTQSQRRDDDGVWFQSHITVPAPDLLSHPTTYGVMGEYPAGALDAEVDVTCQVSSYKRRSDRGEFFNYSLWLASGKKEDAPF